MEKFSKPIKLSDYQPIFYDESRQRYQINYKKEDYYEATGKVDDMCYITYIEFLNCPNSIEIKNAISEQIDLETANNIVNGFIYRKKREDSEELEDKFYRIYLSLENQTNFLRDYNLIKNIQDSGLLPYTIKCGDGYNVEYLVFNTVEEFEHMLLAMSKYIIDCQKEGWRIKDSFDYGTFDIAVRQKFQELRRRNEPDIRFNVTTDSSGNILENNITYKEDEDSSTGGTIALEGSKSKIEEEEKKKIIEERRKAMIAFIKKSGIEVSGDLEEMDGRELEKYIKEIKKRESKN